MKNTDFDWDRIVDEAFADTSVHTFSEKYNDRKRHLERTLTMKKKLRKSRVIGVSLAAAFAACGGTAILATGNFGIFDKLSHTLDRSYVDQNGFELVVDKFETIDFSRIDQAAVPFTAPVTLDGDDVSVTVESVYNDGNTLLLGLSASLKNGNPEGHQYIYFQPYINVDGENFAWDYIHDKDIVGGRSMLYLDEGTQNSFTGKYCIMFNDASPLHNACDAEIRFMNFKPNSNPYGGLRLNEKDFLKDDLRFSLHLEPDDSLVRQIRHTFTDSEGYSECIYDITPAGMQLQCWDYPDYLEHEPPYKKDHPDSKITAIFTDGSGKQLERIESANAITHENGCMYMLYQPPSDDIIHITYYDFVNDVYVHEMTIDLENLTVKE